ncbi:hypothetical protein D9758_017155 [Tetrapyrgos nigripes]|uniref:Uncharacterized protein n=1 Tax=Tetrapyrgos nigripes TaxID=182062 RepID=A0A8H5BTW6_9AGAR|nr:hypothetical protein D9758_017155 [Tetrapyrgos nigripes]
MFITSNDPDNLEDQERPYLDMNLSFGVTNASHLCTSRVPEAAATPWLWSLVTIPLTSAVLVNRTVDDTFGDGQGTTIQYLPEGAWNTSDCKCIAQPTPSLVYDQTWHEAPYINVGNADPFTASLTFNGTALYVYTVLVRNDFLGNTSNLSFYIGDELVGIFTRILSSQLLRGL